MTEGELKLAAKSPLLVEESESIWHYEVSLLEQLREPSTPSLVFKLYKRINTNEGK